MSEYDGSESGESWEGGSDTGGEPDEWASDTAGTEGETAEEAARRAAEEEAMKYDPLRGLDGELLEDI